MAIRPRSEDPKKSKERDQDKESDAYGKAEELAKNQSKEDKEKTEEWEAGKDSDLRK